MSFTRGQFGHDVLLGTVGVHGWRHIGARRAIVAWTIAESGTEPCDGLENQGAAFNLLDTTLPMPGSTFYNFLDENHTLGVQNYTSYQQGVAATVATLRETRYADIQAALKKPFATAKQVLLAVGSSEWGTPTTLLLEVLDRYQADRVFFNQILVGQVSGTHFFPRPQQIGSK